MIVQNHYMEGICVIVPCNDCKRSLHAMNLLSLHAMIIKIIAYNDFIIVACNDYKNHYIQ